MGRAPPQTARTGRQTSGRGGSEEEFARMTTITEVVAVRGLGRDRGDRLRGLRRHDRQRPRPAPRPRAAIAAPATAPASARRRRSPPISLPGDRRGPVRPGRGPVREAHVHRRLQEDHAPRTRRTVVFDLCGPTSRSSRRSRSARSRSTTRAGSRRTSTRPPDGQKIVSAVNGTGPTS